MTGEGTCLGYDFRTQSEAIKRAGRLHDPDASASGKICRSARIWNSWRASTSSTTRSAKVDDTLARLGLTKRQDQLAGELSGGWKQRLALAACMLHSPKLLLLDEPTAGVDPKARRDFWDEIHRLSDEGLTVLVSHPLHGRGRTLRPHRLYPQRQARGARHGRRGDRAVRPLHLRDRRRRRAPAGARSCSGKPGVEYVAFFGAALHVSGRDRAALEDGARALSRTRRA